MMAMMLTQKGKFCIFNDCNLSIKSYWIRLLLCMQVESVMSIADFGKFEELFSSYCRATCTGTAEQLPKPAVTCLQAILLGQGLQRNSSVSTTAYWSIFFSSK